MGEVRRSFAWVGGWGVAPGNWGLGRKRGSHAHGPAQKEGAVLAAYASKQSPRRADHLEVCFMREQGFPNSVVLAGLGGVMCRAGPPPVQSPPPAPLWDSSFANRGTRVSHLTGRTVVAETRGAIKLMHMYADDEW